MESHRIVVTLATIINKTDKNDASGIAKEYEYLPSTSESWIYLSMVRLMLKRITTEILSKVVDFRIKGAYPQ